MPIIKVMLAVTILHAGDSAPTLSPELKKRLAKKYCNEPHVAAAQVPESPSSIFQKIETLEAGDEQVVQKIISQSDIQEPERTGLDAWRFGQGLVLANVRLYSEMKKNQKQGSYRRSLLLVIEGQKRADLIHRDWGDATERKFLDEKRGSLKVRPRHFIDFDNDGAMDLIIDMATGYAYWKEVFMKRQEKWQSVWKGCAVGD